jgi:hypothetical protein
MPRTSTCLLHLLLAGALLAGSGAAARAAVVERFGGDPLAGASDLPFFVEGDAADRFAYVADEPPHFPGDRPGSLRVLYDTTLPAARLSTPLGEVLTLDRDFAFGAVLTLRSQGFQASPDGFSQISFGLWNASTTGLNRTGFPSDSFDLMEFDYFANVTAFGGPFLSPTVFGGQVGDNAFFNFTFASVETDLPQDVPLLCELRYSAATRTLKVTVSRPAGGVFFERIPGAAVTVDLSRLAPTFLLDTLGIAAYTEGAPSLHAEVDFDLIYSGPLPLPLRSGFRRLPAPGGTAAAAAVEPRR